MSNNYQEKKFSTLSLFLIWSGAAVSVAEILSGGALASLGLIPGLLTIIIGHLIGGVFLFLAALMGASMRTSAMESTQYSFGRYGSCFFSWFNVMQLIGWTSIMMLQGARVFDQITLSIYHYSNPNLWMICITLCISLWLVLIARHNASINGVVVIILLLLSVGMGLRIMSDIQIQPIETRWQTITFWQGVELSIAMSLSWLPLIGDYTRYSKSIFYGPLWSSVGYTIVSSCMFALGLGLSLSTGYTDIGQMLVVAGFGLTALFIVLFSTVTTAYLDVYSARYSLLNIYPIRSEKTLSVCLCGLSLFITCKFPLLTIEPFLYLIGSIFAPLYAILFVDFFLLKKPSEKTKHWNCTNMILWAIGLCLYHILQYFLPVISSSLLIILVVGSLTVIVRRIQSHGKA